MTTLVLALRIVTLAVPAALMLLKPKREQKALAREGSSDRAPVLANIAAFGLFFASLVAFAGDREGQAASLLAAAGCLLAVAGIARVLRSRVVLGPAWSLVPAADGNRGFVTTGPYRLVRHPIYLGFCLVATGQALAFGSWPALLVLLFGIVPTFAWRAHAEEQLLGHVFGERYALYRTRTSMIIPYLL